MNAPIPSFDAATHQYTDGGRQCFSVTQILGGLNLTPPYPEDRGQQSLGTAVHKASELDIWDKLDDSRTSSVLMPYIDGFREKKKEMKIRPIYTEIMGVHRVEGYAGTIDLFCTIHDTDLAIIDYKTGTPPRCVELQTAGYGELLRYMETFNKTPRFTHANMPRRFSMQLTPGRAIVRECKDPFDYHAFLGAARLFKWIKERRKD